ncbi:MAG: hypothetical protein A2286_11090 [Gammaproteobacteria bacterium RIFOXYA12_FULL_61_12]|nr:MAG: hypothetical protein A2514_09900 [Gammaproteobacteria bacterium RIFOXYD12_FULL_61_37]OGT92834.1 MAG: hypothetical protein A2286_11090 [Gammaproteobacteria bacterium RIFOXYA12_FULL_61_12]
MQFRSRRREEPDIVVIPLIDVLLMLLIFFMLATTFGTESRIKVQLPEASASAETEQKNVPIKVTIDAEGHIYLDQEELVSSTFDTLTLALQKAIAGKTELPPVIISADAKTPHQAVMTVMDAASRVGLNNMIFAAKQREEN